MFEYIIIGAGSAGSVLAGRLSKSHRVLLIEAGGKPSSPFVSMPAGFAKLFKSKYDWNFESEPCKSVGGRRVFVPRGKMLGGSSNMNAQIHQWCHPADFDEWERAGATGWSWKDVSPVFREQESWTGNDSNPDRGRSGPLRVAPNNNHLSQTAAFVESAREVITNSGDDYNGTAYEGAWICQLAHDRGRRFSCFHGYLAPATGRDNLEILTEALVGEILIEHGRAVGVSVIRRNAAETFRAERGVILAAGAIGSPQVLQLSGIGPADLLTGHGIQVKCDLPEVGRNLQDHPIVPLIFTGTRDPTLKSAESPLNLLKYFFAKRGMLTTNGIEAFAFARSSVCTADAPDIELIFAPFEWRNQGLEPPQIDALTIGPALVAPVSRGSIAIRGNDSALAPAIDLGLLSDPEGKDRRALCDAVDLARQIASTGPLAKDCTAELSPGINVRTEAELSIWFSTCMQTVYHPTSTCRMGTDEGAVVTPDLAVNGIDGLWVGDASVMPSVPRGHPNAVVAMIANRLADRLITE